MDVKRRQELEPKATSEIEVGYSPFEFPQVRKMVRLVEAGMMLGSVPEASILLEAGGGTGSIAFPTANVTAQ